MGLHMSSTIYWDEQIMDYINELSLVRQDSSLDSEKIESEITYSGEGGYHGSE